MPHVRLTDHDVTPPELWDQRRHFIKQGLALAAGSALPFPGRAGDSLSATRNKAFTVNDTLTGFEKVTSYNNFYEFGTDKEDPAQNAGTLKTRPWTVSIEGEVHKPRTFDIESLLKLAPLEERIYRLRCVEAWSMVIPWIGYPLSALIKQVEPKTSARFVEFTTLNDPEQMPGVRRAVLEWPYREGLRMDEAMHPLTLLTMGLYGQVLPPQSGAPIRIVVPWKYGFKSAKSIVRIRLLATQPLTSWNQAAPQEYGFYANVNPAVDHPRWSQSKERRLGDFLKRPTLPFNGYGEQVAALYNGLDLVRNF